MALISVASKKIGFLIQSMLLHKSESYLWSMFEFHALWTQGLYSRINVGKKKEY